MTQDADLFVNMSFLTTPAHLQKGNSWHVWSDVCVKSMCACANVPTH